ncbi:MAG: hypothetical protein IPI45_13480 [Saprospiraceae bacterium]|nr:hypothetical protein [Saprospiraceae bacterium]MBK7738778.1 hypothetical protein [Saprospiraceae bacterium]MBK7912650.1 hypothetical protein [Saprospiraceae bacterium]
MTLFKFLLAIHIFCGGASLLLGFYILITRKGNRSHKNIGTIYFYAMLLTALVAIAITYLHPSYFLFTIGIFTSYMLLTGKSYLRKRSQFDVKYIDWILSIIMLLFGSVLIAMGCYKMFLGNYFGIVHLVFGGFSCLFVYQDYINFKGRSSVQNYWLVTHLQRMIGSYIASVTAFIVVNNTFLPGYIAWLLPTVLLVPLIIIWSRTHENNPNFQ